MQLRHFILASTAAMMPALASAEPVFDRFGELPQTEFGGDGIPNDRVAISDLTVGGLSGVLGISATPRFSNPLPVLIEDGVFGVEPGTNNGTPGQSGDRAKWNFSFYADVVPGVANYVLLYDFDPSLGTDYGQLNLEFFVQQDSGAIEGSQNATFTYLNDGLPPVAIPPSMFDFDADANGIYNFRIQALGLQGELLAEAAIDVIVGDGPTAVPAPAALGLLGLGLLGLGVSRRRRV